MPDRAKHPVKAVKKTVSLLEYLKERDGTTLVELAGEFEMSKSAIHNHLSTLAECGYVKQRDGEYHLSLKFLEIGGYRRKQIQLYQVAEPEVNKLADETGELANLLTEEFGKGVYLYRAKGDEAVDLDTYAGLRCHLHNTALGKSILAHTPEDRVDEIVDRHGLAPQGRNSIETRDELFDELETVRERGYAVDDEERLAGIRCVAAPICDDTDSVLGAVSVSTPMSRMQGDRLETEIPNLVTSAANVIELKIKY